VRRGGAAQVAAAARGADCSQPQSSGLRLGASAHPGVVTAQEGHRALQVGKRLLCLAVQLFGPLRETWRGQPL
jgi:hypothetical protein